MDQTRYTTKRKSITQSDDEEMSDISQGSTPKKIRKVMSEKRKRMIAVEQIQKLPNVPQESKDQMIREIDEGKNRNKRMTKRTHIHNPLLPIPLNNMFETLRGLDDSGDSLDISEYNLSRDDDNIFQEMNPQQAENHDDEEKNDDTVSVLYNDKINNDNDHILTINKHSDQTDFVFNLTLDDVVVEVNNDLKLLTSKETEIPNESSNLLNEIYSDESFVSCRDSLSTNDDTSSINDKTINLSSCSYTSTKPNEKRVPDIRIKYQPQIAGVGLICRILPHEKPSTSKYLALTQFIETLLLQEQPLSIEYKSSKELQSNTNNIDHKDKIESSPKDHTETQTKQLSNNTNIETESTSPINKPKSNTLKEASIIKTPKSPTTSDMETNMVSLEIKKVATQIE